MVILGDIFPNFEAHTTKGTFYLHDYIDDHWCLFFSHPAAFTPVCTSELAEAAQLKCEFDRRNVKIIAVSSNKIESHAEWIHDIIDYGDLNELPYPIIEDPNQIVAKSLGMIDQTACNSDGIYYTCRGVIFLAFLLNYFHMLRFNKCFLIAPDKRIKMTLFYPAWVGRDFNELLRVIDSIQLCETYPVATPVNWEPGDKCMIPPKFTDEEVKKIFKKSIEHLQMPSKKDYMRFAKIS